MKIIESPGSQIVSDPKHDQFGGRFFCTRGLTTLFLWNILRWSGRSHHIPHLQSYFRDGLKPQLAFNKLDALRQQFLICWDSSGFSGKKTIRISPYSGRQLATTWSLQLFKILITCGALFRAPDLKLCLLGESRQNSNILPINWLVLETRISQS
jgi:hypothetical protein